MTSQSKFRWTGLLIFVSVLLVASLYKQIISVSASNTGSGKVPAVASGVGPSHPAAPMDANDLLVLRFDNSLNGENGETPTTATGTSFQPGVNNQGVLLPNPNQLFYASANNINATEGTFEWWMKPTWSGNDGLGHIILQYGVGGGIVIGKDGANNLRIILNRFGVAPGGEVGVAFNVGSWEANQWHHIAFTWSNSTKQLAVYSDGTLQQQVSFTINLPAVASPTLQIGGDGGGDYIQAVVDNLRISNIARTAQEISNHMLEGVTVTGWSLNPVTTAIELWPTWYWWITPTITANTNVGTLSLPVLAASWASLNPSVAILETSSGRFKALTPGSAVLTGTLGGAQNSFTINVVTPPLPPVDEAIDPLLAMPASNYLHRMPVVIIRYFPTRDGVNLDAAATGTTSTLAALKSNVEQIERRHKFMLEEGSRFRGYSNAAAQPALGYQIIKIITVYEEIPPGVDAGGGAYIPDYHQILARFGGENFVNNLGVKEFWLVQYHNGRIVPVESNMSSPTTGDISNSYRINSDQPIYNKTYVTYGINFTRSHAEATHNHGHQLESILSYVNQLRDGNTDLWWGKFARAANNPPARCGNTHFPPNALTDYDYTNLNPVASDIIDWQPLGGPTTMVNADTWGNVPYAWPGGTAPPQEVESKWYIFWFQSMAGRGNTIPFNSNRLTNWWQFTADWDAAIQGGLGLYESGSCSYALSTTSQSVPLGGGTFTVNVTGGAGCKWIASSNATWANLSSGTFGNGNGTVTFTVAATGASRSGTLAIANQLFTINQTGGSCPTITINPANSTLPASAVGQSYNQTFSATGGTGAYTFSIVAGTLPTGLSLNVMTGVLSGTVGALGTFNFTVRATDGNGCFGERAYTLPVTSTCPTITSNPNSGTLPNGAVGTPYSLTFSASGGTGPYTYSVLAGLPLGLTLNATTGALTGTPTGGGSYSFTLRVLDANNCVGARVHTIIISGPCGFALNPTSASFPADDSGDFVNVTTANGCAWTASSNNAWITIDFGASGNGSGLLGYLVAANAGPQRTGTMTIAGKAFTVTQDAFVCPSIMVNPSSLPNGFVGAAYNQTVIASGGVAPHNFTVSGGALPAGVILSTAGALSGMPTATGTFTFTIKATDTNGCIGTQVYTVIISGNGLMFYPLTSPVRLLDTRGNVISPNACTVNGSQPIAANTSLLQMARSTCAIPANAQAITGNVTTVTSGGGYLTLYPSGAVRPTVASINYNPNEIVNNVFTAGLGAADGKFNIYALNSTDTIIDVTGYYAPPSGTGLYFHPLPAPVRLLETRAGLSPPVVGCVQPGAPLAGNADSLQTATGACTGIPAAARAIVGNATTVSPQGGGYLTLFPADASRPLIGSSNYDTGQIVNGPFTTGLSASGQFKVFTLATTDLVIDVLGYYSAEVTDANGAGLLFTPLAHPVRLLETRNVLGFPGCFKPNAPLNGNQVYIQSARGTCDGLTIPTTALGVVGNATVVSPAAGGYLTLWPSTAAQPTVATANYNGGQIVNRHFIVGLGNADGAFKMFSYATTDLVIDLTGYFAP
ncbi:MAG: putative Ig domain-containing protein [Acidobacteriota bacterium]|nr:putative Ig domain-containing protein [Acidobacteriota bacterium]